MKIQGIYAALATADMNASEAFYTKLFERGPDDRPMDGLIQWRDVSGAHIQIFRDEGGAGAGRLTIVVPAMAAAREALAAIGVAVAEEREGEFGRIAQIRDPDGNRLTLAEPPRSN